MPSLLSLSPKSDCTTYKQSVYFIKEYLKHMSICWSMVLGDILRSPQKKERKQKLLPSGRTQSIKQYKTKYMN